jgi:hypothetical protein
MSHGSALCGTALTLAGAVRRFFVPSSKSYTTLELWGSDPLIDVLLSTERLQIIHDGAAFTRFACGLCSNCRRTMMVLAALGVFDEFETFPPVTSPTHFLTSGWDTPHERLFGKQLITYAAANGRTGLVWAGRYGAQLGEAGLEAGLEKTTAWYLTWPSHF